MIFMKQVSPGVTLMSPKPLAGLGANCTMGAWAQGTGTQANLNCRTNSCATSTGGKECVPFKNPGIASLQQALIVLATASGKPGIAPIGGVTGTYDANTRNAVLAALPVIGGELDSNLALALDGLDIAAAFNTGTADSIIQQYADVLTPVILLAAQNIQPTLNPLLPGYTPVVAVTPWYQQTWGMAAIGVGALAILFVLFSKPPAPAYYPPQYAPPPPPGQ